MNYFAPLAATASLAVARAREASRFGLMGNGSWSIRPCFAIVPTTDHKHQAPRRLTVIPT